MMRQAGAFFLCLALCQSLCAQVPGYLGRRMTLTVELGLSPNLNQFGAGRAPLRLLTTPGVALERVLSRRFGLQIQASAFAPLTDYTWQGRSGQLKLQGQQLRVGWRLYNFLQRGNLAPVGPYQEVSLFGLHHRPLDQQRQLLPNGRQSLGDFFDLGIGVALGTHWMLSRRWLIDLCLRADWPFDLIRRETLAISPYLHELSTNRLRRFMGLRLQVGVGMLW